MPLDVLRLIPLDKPVTLVDSPQERVIAAPFWMRSIRHGTDGRFTAVGGTFADVHVLTSSLKFTTCAFTAGWSAYVRSPHYYDACTNSKGWLIVLCILEPKTHSSLLIYCGANEPVEVELEGNPRLMCISPKDDSIFVAEDRRAIRQLSYTGKYMRSFTHSTPKEIKPGVEYEDLAVLHDGTLIASLQALHGLYVWRKGLPTCEVIAEDVVKCPSRLAVDARDRIAVLERFRKHIQLLDPQGAEIGGADVGVQLSCISVLPTTGEIVVGHLTAGEMTVLSGVRAKEIENKK